MYIYIYIYIYCCYIYIYTYFCTPEIDTSEIPVSAKRTLLREDNLWEDELAEHRIRARRAVSATGLQGKGSCARGMLHRSLRIFQRRFPTDFRRRFLAGLPARPAARSEGFVYQRRLRNLAGDPLKKRGTFRRTVPTPSPKIAGDPPKKRRAHGLSLWTWTPIGRHYLSNAACLMRPHMFYAFFVVSRITIICHIIENQR